MLSQQQGLHRSRADAEFLSKMHAKPKAIEVGAGAQHPRVICQASSMIGKRVRWIGHDEQHGVRRRPHDPGHDLLIDFDVLVEELEPPGWIVAIGGTSGLLVDACRDHDQRGAGQVVVVPIADFGDRRERRSVAHVGCDRLGALAGPIEQHDLACRPAHDRRQGTCGPDRSHADNADLHDATPTASP